MNIQINCKENVSENDLRYIFYNLQGYIKKYEEEKNDVFKTRNGIWTHKAIGNIMIKPNIEIKCNGKTMYFKVRGDNK